MPEGLPPGVGVGGGGGGVDLGGFGMDWYISREYVRVMIPEPR